MENLDGVELDRAEQDGDVIDATPNPQGERLAVVAETIGPVMTAATAEPLTKKEEERYELFQAVYDDMDWTPEIEE